ncbi:hypothetical protein BC940DRAFT_301170 [Gongronella butleri]|nr:hypothetical protein BC940DRAFT_301170 [Gongronella butleri]
MICANVRQSKVISCLIALTALVQPGEAGSQAFALNGCAVASNAIWCYGGGTRVSNGLVVGESNALVKLDMSSYDFTDLQFNWQSVAPNGLSLDESWLHSMSSTQNGLMIFGGFGNNNTVVNTTIVYNEQTNTWVGSSVLPPDWAAANHTYPIYTSIVDLASTGQQKMWIWGGLNNNTILGTTSNAQLFDYSANTWSTSIASATPSGKVRFRHSASLSNDGANIFVIGGRVVPSGLTNWTSIDMTEVWVFATASGQWTTKIATSDSALGSRQYHTAETIPNSELIFIYGGMDASNTSVRSNYPIISGADVALVYDYGANRFYTPQIGGNGSPGPLVFHSSVLYTDPNTNNSYVAILDGTNLNLVLQSATYFLNVTNSTSLQWVGTQQGSSSGTSDTTSSTGGGLSTGAIAGIAVGAAVFAIAGSVLALFLYNRHRKNKQDFVVQQTDPRVNSIDSPHDVRSFLFDNQNIVPETVDYTTTMQSGSSVGHTTLVHDQVIKPTALEHVKPFGKP